MEQIPGKDKREKRMKLTEIGMNIYEDVRVTIDQFEESILKGITEEERLEAVRIMDVIRNNINK
ncbi:MarR family transcriptional regulator [Oceanobacillus caeni]